MRIRRREAAIDTNVLLDLFNEDLTVLERIEEIAFLWIPFPVIAEMVFGFPKLKNSDPHKDIFETFLSRKDVEIISCDKKVEKKFSDIKRDLRKKGSMIPVNDIWIAACCLNADLPLATRDIHFQRIADLKIEVW